MSIYYQHIGERLWERDGPRSIGLPDKGVRRFYIDDIRPFIDEIDPFERIKIENIISEFAPTGFQI
jgi:hypothetical protein